MAESQLHSSNLIDERDHALWLGDLLQLRRGEVGDAWEHTVPRGCESLSALLDIELRGLSRLCGLDCRL